MPTVDACLSDPALFVYNHRDAVWYNCRTQFAYCACIKVQEVNVGGQAGRVLRMYLNDTLLGGRQHERSKHRSNKDAH